MLLTGWHNPDAGPAHQEWARRVIAAASQASTGIAYVNFLGDRDAARTSSRATKRTPSVSLKDEYYLTQNVFRLNQNIGPSAAGS